MTNWIRSLSALVICAVLLCLCACGTLAEETEIRCGGSIVNDGLTDADRFDGYISRLFGLDIPRPARRIGIMATFFPSICLPTIGPIGVSMFTS